MIERALAEPNQKVILDSEGNREAWWVPITEGQEREPTFNDPKIAKRTRIVGKDKNENRRSFGAPG